MKRLLVISKLLLGFTLVLFGICAEIRVWLELSENDTKLIATKEYYVVHEYPDLPRVIGSHTEEEDINPNIHILVGLCTVAGAMLLNGVRIENTSKAN